MRKQSLLVFATVVSMLTVVSSVQGKPPRFPDDFFYPANPQSNYARPGALQGQGIGNTECQDHIPYMRFPLKGKVAFVNSQVWGHGGLYGKTKDEKNKENFSYPWYDNYCEFRSADQKEATCPSRNQVHQGIDIRGGDAWANKWEVVAAVNGDISTDNPEGNAARIDLKSRDENHIFVYLHMSDDRNPQTGAAMTPTRPGFGTYRPSGTTIGRVSRVYGLVEGRYHTTTHLHFEIIEAFEDGLPRRLPPYCTLIAAFERRLRDED